MPWQNVKPYLRLVNHRLHLCLSTSSRMDLLPDVWRRELWLPSGVTWEDMEKLADSDRPLPRDLLLALPLSLGFVALRFLFER